MYVYFAQFPAQRTFLATIWSDNDKRWTCELATAPYAAQMPDPSLLSLPPTTPGYHMLIVVFKSTFGPHFWAEMNAIVVNGTIAVKRKMPFREICLQYLLGRPTGLGV